MPQPRKSEAEHALHGTISQAEVPDAPPVESTKPRVPKHLSSEAKAIFRDYMRKLAARRALTQADGPLLELAAQLTARYRRAMAKVDAEGEIVMYPRKDTNGQFRDVPARNMWLDIANDCESKLTGILDRLGFTPMNRPKIQPTKSAQTEGIIFK